MSYNGSGTFQINSSGQPVVTGTVISSTAFNALTADLATGLSTAITKDGQTTTTSRILFAQGISSTLVTDATSATTGSIITAGGISTQKALWVGTTSRLVGNVQADGLVGIGMTPSNVLDITQSQNAASQVKLLNSNGSSGAQSNFFASNGTNTAQFGIWGTGATTSGAVTAGNAFVYGDNGISYFTGGTHKWYISTNTEAARFDTSGNLCVGTTSNGGFRMNVVAASGYGAGVQASNGNTSLIVSNATGGSQTYVRFYASSTETGRITTDGTNTSYTSLSDERLKTNVSDAAPASALIDAIQVRQFDWKVDNSHQRYGMVAQELLEVAPEAVSVSTDPEQMMGVDYSKLVPMLIKEVQSLRTRLEALEAK